MKTTRFLFVISLYLFLPVLLAKAGVVTNTIVVNDIEYYLQADKNIYDQGENIDILFRVTNQGDEVLWIGTSYPIMDLFIYEKEGELYNQIWNWSWDKLFPAGPVIFKLQPNESVELNSIWGQIDLNNSLNPEDHIQVSPGSFKISGYLNPTDINVTLDIVVIPEPTSIILLFIGGILLRKNTN